MHQCLLFKRETLYTSFIQSKKKKGPGIKFLSFKQPESALIHFQGRIHISAIFRVTSLFSRKEALKKACLLYNHCFIFFFFY
jgi:hypothetical protein